jgi:S-adenosylmethionine:tRNA ribosyltransferase-isomerase
MRTAEFFYDLPDAAIAQTPVEPRHAARLLDTRDLTDRVFSEVPVMLAGGDLVVVNRTRVRAARLRGTKVETGGSVEVLLLSREEAIWEVLVRPARRIRSGQRLAFRQGLQAVVHAAPVEGRCTIEFLDVDESHLESLIEGAGEVPLPPYIHTPLQDPDRYQTVYAGELGSAAAPTAGLHFSERVLEDLNRRGIGLAYVDLRVGLDTFRPISTDGIDDHHIHSERFTVPEATSAAVGATRRRGGRVVAVGTTVVRSLESAVDREGRVRPFDGSTDLFIKPGYSFRAIDGVITNFHVPGSTLVVLVAAVLGDRWRLVYESALARGYRFLSFGDAMYAEVERR